MKVIATAVATLALLLGTAGAASAITLPKPPVAGAPHLPAGHHWVKCPGNPRILLACYKR